MAFKPSLAGSFDFVSVESSGVYYPGSLVYGVRTDADAAPVADGLPHVLQTNAIGRLKVSALPSASSATTGTITANGQNVQCDVQRASNVMMYVTGTFSTINLTFEGSIDGGVTWFGIQACRTNANTIETTTGNLSAAPAYAWEMSVNAMTHVRVRATAYTSGTMNVRWLPGAYATEPIPAIQTHAVTQSGTWNVTVNAAIAAGTNAIGDVGTQYRANATGAASGTHIVSAATTNATIIKASAGRLLGWYLLNTNAATRYVKFHNQATSPTAGTGVVRTVGIPPNGIAQFNMPGGIAFTTGIAMTTVTGSADADTAAVGAGDIVGDIFFA